MRHSLLQARCQAVLLTALVLSGSACHHAPTTTPGQPAPDDASAAVPLEIDNHNWLDDPLRANRFRSIDNRLSSKLLYTYRF